MGGANKGKAKMRLPPDLQFSLEDLERAKSDWGCNCGPAAIAAVTELTLDELRPHLGDFEKKQYTNPKLMFKILDALSLPWEKAGVSQFPSFGLARVQWEGPWTSPDKSWHARQRHTHWVGCCSVGHLVFDINAVCVGGWISEAEWGRQLVPWLLAEVEPEADGEHFLTHCIEIYE